MTTAMLLMLLGTLPPASEWLLRERPPSAAEYRTLLEERPGEALLLSGRTGWVPGEDPIGEAVADMAGMEGRRGRLASWACTACGLAPPLGRLSPGLVELGPETVLPDAPEACQRPLLVHAGLLRALHSITAGIPMHRPQDAVELAIACREDLPDSTRVLALQVAGRVDVTVPPGLAPEEGLAGLRYLAETGGTLASRPQGLARGLEALYSARCLPDSALYGWMEHPDWYVRRVVAEALPPGELEPLLDDPVPYVALAAARRMQESGLSAGRRAMAGLAREPGPVGDMATAGLTAGDRDLLEELMDSRRPARRAAAQGAWLQRGLFVDSALARRWETDPYWIVPVSWVYHLEQEGEMGRARTTAERIAGMAEEAHRPERLLSHLEEIVTGGPAGAGEEEPEWPESDLPFDPGAVERADRLELRTTEGAVVLELLWDTAPIACANMVHLAREGFYDGIWVHRVEPGFVAQAGCPQGNGMGGPGYTIPGEPGLTAFDRGVVGMADAGPGTAGSQFFIMLDSHRRLDTRYTAFARVVEGMEAAERLTVGSRIEAVDIR
jgi:cyclophilin family peptidyl-prolyl cis-trans isomerase